MRCPVSNNGQPHLSRKTPWPYVNPYHFHIIDPDWGHITIKMSGHPPFGIQVMLNGHEWVERKAIKQTISLEKEGNCFVGGSFQALDQLADTLCDYHAVGRLTKVLPPGKSEPTHRRKVNPLNRKIILASYF